MAEVQTRMSEPVRPRYAPVTSRCGRGSSTSQTSANTAPVGSGTGCGTGEVVMVSSDLANDERNPDDITTTQNRSVNAAAVVVGGCRGDGQALTAGCRILIGAAR